jgi:hypothetical protein
MDNLLWYRLKQEKKIESEKYYNLFFPRSKIEQQLKGLVHNEPYGQQLRHYLYGQYLRPKLWLMAAELQWRARCWSFAKNFRPLK